MSKEDFFVVFPDPKRDDLEAVDEYDLESELIQKFWTGKSIRAWHPEAASITVDHGKKADLLGNPFCWLIVSNRVRNVLERLSRDNVQILPLPITGPTGRMRLDYHVVNVLGFFDAVAGMGAPRQKIALDKIQLDVTKIPNESHIIRLKTHPLVTVVSGTCLKELKRCGARGISFLKIAS